MKKDNIDFLPQIDFSDVTPEMLLKNPKSNPLYEKAFYSKGDVNDSEYCQNTTTWD